MTERPDRLMLLDTASLYFRAFYGIPDTITAPDGTPVNAVRGLLDFITRLVDDHQPTRLVAAMDANWRPDFRVALLPSYKAHRVANPVINAEEVPDLLEAQVPIIEDVLDAIGIAKFGVAGYEADDVIGTLSHASKIPVDIVTGDRDLFQLVDDDRGRPDPLHGAGHEQARGRGQRPRGGQVRRPGRVVRRLRRVARRPLGRPARVSPASARRPPPGCWVAGAPSRAS